MPTRRGGQKFVQQMEFMSTINVERGQTIGANLSLTNEQKVFVKNFETKGVSSK